MCEYNQCKEKWCVIVWGLKLCALCYCQMFYAKYGVKR